MRYDSENSRSCVPGFSDTATLVNLKFSKKAGLQEGNAGVLQTLGHYEHRVVSHFWLQRCGLDEIKLELSLQSWCAVH